MLFKDYFIIFLALVPILFSRKKQRLDNFGKGPKYEEHSHENILN